MHQGVCNHGSDNRHQLARAFGALLPHVAQLGPTKMKVVGVSEYDKREILAGSPVSPLTVTDLRY